MNALLITRLFASGGCLAFNNRHVRSNRKAMFLLWLLVSLSFTASTFAAGPAQVPGAPTALSAAPGNSQVTLTWNAPSGYVTSYNVYRGTTAGGESATAIQTGLTTLTYVDAGLTNGTTYYYKVAAVNNVGTGSKSSEISATPFPQIGAPANLVVAAVSSSQINLSWSVSAGAVSYSVERSPDGSIGWTQIATPTTLSFQDVALAVGTSYFYRVSAVNASGASSPSPNVSAITFPAAPANLTATANATQLSLSWSGSLGAASYTVERSTVSGGPYTILSTAGSVTGTTYADTSVISGTTYYYVVAAVNASGSSPVSSEANANFILLSAPISLSEQAGNQQVTLSWSAVGGATGYTVKRSIISGGPYTNVTIPGILTDTSYTDQYLTNGTTYYYVVTAVSNAGESANSTEVSATPIGPPAAPTNLVAQPGYQQVTLTWTASAVTTGYNIYRGTSSGGESATPVNAVPLTSTSYTDTGLTTGTTYYYTVVAVNSYGAGSPTGEANATLVLPPDTPASLVATPGTGQVTLSWAVPSGPITGYVVQRATTTGGPYTPLVTGTGTTYTDAAVVNGTPYFYVVTAYNISGSGAASDEAMAEPFVSPAAPSVTPNYGYDSSGLRAWKLVGNNSTRLSPVYFLYDGSQPVCELDSTGAVTATNTWAGGLISRRAGSASTFYTFDPQGNVVQRLDAGANVLGTYAFDAFGLRDGTDSTTDPYSSFGGEYGYYADAGASLELLGHRYYDPGTGRFLTRDPIGYAGGADLYAYCGNNPIMGADPSGFCDDGLDDARDADPTNLWNPLDAPGMSTDAWIRAGNGTGTIPAAMATTTLAGLSVYGAGKAVVVGAAGLALAAWRGVGELAADGGSYVYRALADGEYESLADGLYAREPTAITDPLSHVANKRASEWVSTSKSLENALGRDSDKGYGVVRINLSKVGTDVKDLSGGIPNGGRFSSYAKGDQEVLIRWFVPPDAITVIHP